MSTIFAKRTSDAEVIFLQKVSIVSVAKSICDAKKWSIQWGDYSNKKRFQNRGNRGVLFNKLVALFGKIAICACGIGDFCKNVFV